jgi:hypothetical protein
VVEKSQFFLGGHIGWHSVGSIAWVGEVGTCIAIQLKEFPAKHLPGFEAQNV